MMYAPPKDLRSHYRPGWKKGQGLTQAMATGYDASMSATELYHEIMVPWAKEVHPNLAAPTPAMFDVAGWPEGKVFLDPKVRERERGKFEELILPLRKGASEYMADLAKTYPAVRNLDPRDLVDDTWEKYLKPEMERLGLPTEGDHVRNFIQASLLFPVGDLTDPALEPMLLAQTGSNLMASRLDTPEAKEDLAVRRAQTLKQVGRAIRKGPEIGKFQEKWLMGKKDKDGNPTPLTAPELDNYIDDLGDLSKTMVPYEYLNFLQQQGLPGYSETFERRRMLLDQSPFYGEKVTDWEVQHTTPEWFGDGGAARWMSLGLYSVAQSASTMARGVTSFYDAIPILPDLMTWSRTWFPVTDTTEHVVGIAAELGTSMYAGGRLLTAAAIPMHEAMKGTLPTMMDSLNYTSRAAMAADNVKWTHRMGLMLSPDGIARLSGKWLFGGKGPVGKPMQHLLNAEWFKRAQIQTPLLSLAPTEILNNLTVSRLMTRIAGRRQEQWSRFWQGTDWLLRSATANYFVNANYGRTRVSDQGIDLLIDLALTAGLVGPRQFTGVLRRRVDDLWTGYRAAELDYIKTKADLTTEQLDSAFRVVYTPEGQPASVLQQLDDAVTLGQSHKLRNLDKEKAQEDSRLLYEQLAKDAPEILEGKDVNRMVEGFAASRSIQRMTTTEAEKKHPLVAKLHSVLNGALDPWRTTRYFKKRTMQYEFLDEAGSPTVVEVPLNVADEAWNTIRGSDDISTMRSYAVFTSVLNPGNELSTEEMQSAMRKLDLLLSVRAFRDYIVRGKQLPGIQLDPGDPGHLPSRMEHIARLAGLTDSSGIGVMSLATKADYEELYIAAHKMLVNSSEESAFISRKRARAVGEFKEQRDSKKLKGEITNIFRAMGRSAARGEEYADRLLTIAATDASISNDHQYIPGADRLYRRSLARGVRDAQEYLAGVLNLKPDAAKAIRDMEPGAFFQRYHRELMDKKLGPAAEYEILQRILRPQTYWQMKHLYKSGNVAADLMDELKFTDKTAMDSDEMTGILRDKLDWYTKGTPLTAYDPESYIGVNLTLGPAVIAGSKQLKRTERLSPAMVRLYQTALGDGHAGPDMAVNRAVQKMYGNVLDHFEQWGRRLVDRGFMTEEALIQNPNYVHRVAHEFEKAEEINSRLRLRSRTEPTKEERTYRKWKQPWAGFLKRVEGGRSLSLDAMNNFMSYSKSYYKMLMFDDILKALDPLDQFSTIAMRYKLYVERQKLFSGEVEPGDVPGTSKGAARVVMRTAEGEFLTRMNTRKGEEMRPLRLGDRIRVYVDLPMEQAKVLLRHGTMAKWQEQYGQPLRPHLEREGNLAPDHVRVEISTKINPDDSLLELAGGNLRMQELDRLGVDGTDKTTYDALLKINDKKAKQYAENVTNRTLHALGGLSDTDQVVIKYAPTTHIQPYKANMSDADVQRQWDHAMGEARRFLDARGGRGALLSSQVLLGPNFHMFFPQTGKATSDGSALDMAIGNMFRDIDLESDPKIRGEMLGKMELEALSMPQRDDFKKWNRARPRVFDTDTVSMLQDLDTDSMRRGYNWNKHVPQFVSKGMTELKRILLSAPGRVWAYQMRNIATDTEKIMRFVPARDWFRFNQLLKESADEIYGFQQYGAMTTDMIDAQMRGVMTSYQLRAEDLQEIGYGSLYHMYLDLIKLDAVDVANPGRAGERFLNDMQEVTIGSARGKAVMEKLMAGLKKMGRGIKMTPELATRFGTFASEVREQSYRLAMYKYLNEAGAKRTGDLVSSGLQMMTRPSTLEGLNLKTQSGRVARQLFVDYRNPSPAMEGLRGLPFPFGTWREASTRQEIIALQNLGTVWRNREGMWPATQAAAMGLAGIPFAMLMWNKVIVPFLTNEEPLELGETIEGASHLVFPVLLPNGKLSQLDDQDRPRVVTNITGMGDGFSSIPILRELSGMGLLGIGNVVSEVEDWIQQTVYPTPNSPAGQYLQDFYDDTFLTKWYGKTLSALTPGPVRNARAVAAVAKTGVVGGAKHFSNVAIQNSNPAVKAGMEALRKQRYYPDAWNPTPNADVGGSLVHFITGGTFTHLYNVMMKRPDKYPQTTSMFGTRSLVGFKLWMEKQIGPSQVFTSPDMVSENYFDSLRIKDDFKTNVLQDSIMVKDRKLLNNITLFRRSLAMGDYELADTIMEHVIKNNDAMMDYLKRHVDSGQKYPSGHPLNGIKPEYLEYYVEQLSDQEQMIVENGIIAYHEEMDPKRMLEMFNMWKRQKDKSVWDRPEILARWDLERLRSERARRRILLNSGMTEEELGPMSELGQIAGPMPEPSGLKSVL